jgi:phage head maturation protease
MPCGSTSEVWIVIHTRPTPICEEAPLRQLSKVEENDDGTVRVFGIASTESKDHDGEVIKASAVKAALPDWLVFGNIREMHQPIAAGTAIEASVDDDGVTHLGALIVDPSTVKKVKAGVLKGFSLGGKVTKRNAKDKSIIEGFA